MPIQIGGFLYVPEEGSESDHTDSSILVRMIEDFIYQSDLKAITSALTARFPAGEYELIVPDHVLSAGETKVRVFVRYTQAAGLRRTQSEGKFIPVSLQEISTCLKSLAQVGNLV